MMLQQCAHPGRAPFTNLQVDPLSDVDGKNDSRGLSVENTAPNPGYASFTRICEQFTTAIKNSEEEADSLELVRHDNDDKRSY